MPEIRTIIDEPRRGCGYRRAGGTYLMAAGMMGGCGRLPLRLDICPCCGAGVRPARGWTWVNASVLFGATPCAGATGEPGERGCDCPLNVPPERAGLIWIGETFYRTPADFIREGVALGISRRVHALPRGFTVGETLILLAHRKAFPFLASGAADLRRESVESGGVQYTPGIFGAFLPTRIEYIVRPEDTVERLERLEARGFTLIRLLRTEQQALPMVEVDYEVVDDGPAVPLADRIEAEREDHADAVREDRELGIDNSPDPR